MSSPTEFNDPFDMVARFVMDGTEAERRERFEELIEKQSPHRGWRARQAAVEELMSSADGRLAEFCRGSLARVRAAAGVYCFAGNAKNILMWSHYAANHTGVCLQLERARDFTTLSHALSVKYQMDLPNVNWITNPHVGIKEMLLAKHPCWAYEQERRISIPDQAGLYLPFRSEALVSIVLGCRIGDPNIETITKLLEERSAAGHPPVAVYVASQNATKYKLIIGKNVQAKPL
jgi:hypothetical protein